MKRGDLVSFKLTNGAYGEGYCIADQTDDGSVLVAITLEPSGVRPEMHRVIHCQVTWLTKRTSS